jgi:hypothetical protein
LLVFYFGGLTTFVWAGLELEMPEEL